MNIIGWNCRGIGGPRKYQFIKDLLNSTQADILFLSETKASTDRMKKFIPTLPLKNHAFYASKGLSGGIALCWSDTINLQVLEVTQNHIWAKIIYPYKPPWYLIGVYGDPTRTYNKKFWDYLQQILLLNTPTCITGDFNAISSSGDKHGGNSKLKTDDISFQKFISNSGLLDLDFSGPAYTWVGRQHTSSPIFERLDRFLVTPTWLSRYPSSMVKHLPRIHSDHSPIILKTDGFKPIKKQFRVEHSWFLDKDFSSLCEHYWSSSQNSVRDMS
ncbi:Endonuclease/exonuclease/phosphatase family protein [Rhynchospora pubera]|uniref:Endonuclease/exonuclease/phosphatase family protein n=1 Tax=Rhynchospora pubera TaxID=906938 RepID=A0AAV8EWN0_9POAL|nr:Endonuclease/exonuclease/phosphatase family protein [Rhynchospora pubera]